jgi:membrane-bound inhibitor of C-type lysozyme
MFARTVAAITVAACAKPVPTTTYVCEGGDSLVVGFAESRAELRLPPNRVVRLPAVRSASGVRYSDGRYTVQTKGDEALMEQGGVVLRCLKIGASLPDTALTPARAMAEAEAINR